MDFGAGGLMLQIGGALSSGISSYFGAASQKSALNFQARMSEINARITELGAQSALNQGEKEVGRLTLRAGQLKSSQRASMAANGVDLGVGSAAEVLASTDIMKEIDSNQITANATRSAWGMRTQATNYMNDALINRASASGISPIGSAATSLLGSAGKVASSWYTLNNSGALDLAKANMSSDPIGALGALRGW